MKSNELGEIELSEKVRGSSKVFNRLAEIIESTNVNFSERIAVISHANAIEKALGLKAKIEKLRFKDIIIVETNGLSTSYVNDGGVIISF
jgi:fatty acid-binding protein DegV